MLHCHDPIICILSLTLSVVDDALGTELFSPAEILETRAVKFTCSFSQITLGVGEISRIHLQAKVDNVWQSQVNKNDNIK